MCCKLLMQIFSQHEYSGDAGLVILMSDNVNLASYFTGHEHQIFVILFLTEQEDGNLFEDGLADIAREMLLHIDSPDLNQILEHHYPRLEIYPRITNEQKLAMVFLNDIKRNVTTNRNPRRGQE